MIDWSFVGPPKKLQCGGSGKKSVMVQGGSSGDSKNPWVTEARLSEELGQQLFTGTMSFKVVHPLRNFCPQCPGNGTIHRGPEPRGDPHRCSLTVSIPTKPQNSSVYDYMCDISYSLDSHPLSCTRSLHPSYMVLLMR